MEGISFGTTSFTITAVEDTDNVLSCGAPCLYNDNLSVSIEISGVGTLTFVTPTRYFSNVGIVGFSRAGFGGLDLFNGPAVPGWDMVTSVGPIVGTANLLQWGLADVETTGGTLFFANGSSSSTFTATVGAVPEPSTLFVVAGGLVGLLSLRRKRR